MAAKHGEICLCNLNDQTRLSSVALACGHGRACTACFARIVPHVSSFTFHPQEVVAFVGAGPGLSRVHSSPKCPPDGTTQVVSVHAGMKNGVVEVPGSCSLVCPDPSGAGKAREPSFVPAAVRPSTTGSFERGLS